MTIHEILSKIAPEDLQIQRIDENATDYKCGKKQATITFTTDPKIVQDYMQCAVHGGIPKMHGLIIWVPTEKWVEAAIVTP